MAFADSLYKVKIETIDGAVECVGASYNGVPFFVEEVGFGGGRNVATTALPNSNNFVNEDLGKKLQQYAIRFYLVGEDANSQREKLEEAFNESGAHELIHPYYGKFQARCTNYGGTISLSECEYISGDAVFVPESAVSAAALSVVKADSKGQAMAFANAASEESKSNFKKDFSIVGAAKSIVNALVDGTNMLLDEIEEARSAMRSVNEFVGQISQFRENLSLIMQTPAEFATRIEDLITMTSETVSIRGGITGYVNESLTLMDRIEVDDGPMVQNEQKATIQKMALMMAASAAVKNAMSATFENAEQVHEMQQSLTEVFDNAMGKVNDMDCFKRLSEMLGAALKYLTDVVANLAVIVDLPLLTTRDSLSLCFDCYGSLDKFENMIERNSIEDPMVINRTSLKVLSK